MRNYSFDTVIIGTSHSENFFTSTLDEYMKSKSINLAISGSSAWEQAQVIKLALTKNEVKRVVWEMNYKSFSGENPNLVKSGSFPNYLYEPDLTTPFYYLYSLDTLWLSVKHLFRRGGSDLDGLNSWFDNQKDKFDGLHVVDHYCHLQSSPVEERSIRYEVSIKEYLEPLLGINKNINYVLFIPPLSVANFSLNNQLENFVAFREVLYRIVLDYKNVRIIDFVADLDVIGDLHLYKDIEHYSLGVSNDMLETMSKNNLVSVEHNEVKERNNQLKNFVSMWKEKNHLCD